MSDDKKKPISYFLDHPQIKRSKSWGNGAVPNNWEAGQKPADRINSNTNNKLSGKSNEDQNIRHNEALQVEQTQKTQRNFKPKKDKVISKTNKRAYSKTEIGAQVSTKRHENAGTTYSIKKKKDGKK